MIACLNQHVKTYIYIYIYSNMIFITIGNNRKGNLNHDKEEKTMLLSS